MTLFLVHLPRHLDYLHEGVMPSPEFTNLEVSLHLFHFGHTRSQVCSDNFANNIKGKRVTAKILQNMYLKPPTVLAVLWSQLWEQQTA